MKCFISILEEDHAVSTWRIYFWFSLFDLVRKVTLSQIQFSFDVKDDKIYFSDMTPL